MKKNPILPLLLFLLMIPASAPGATPVTREHLVAEPVFGGRAFVLEAGEPSSPSLLLVHGLGDEASSTWKEMIPALAREFHVLAVDLPGFGRSEKRNALYSPGRYAAYLRWVADRFAPGPLTVVGHSLGGAVALRFAADYPQSLQRLVLIDVAGILHRRAVTRDLLDPNLSERLPQFPAAPLERFEDWIGGVISRLPSPPLDLDFVLANEELRARVLAGDPARIAAVALIQEDYSRSLRQVQVPTVLLWGENDRVTPLRTGLLLESLLPRARLQVIPAAGHVPMADQPGLLAQALRQALLGPPSPERTILPAGERLGVCDGQSGVTFSGPFDRLEITGCTDVRLTRVAAREAVISRSRVIIEQSRISSRKTALQVSDSTVTATGLRLEGDTALAVAGSRLDLAGVDLVGRSAAVKARGPASLLFSVSRAESPPGERYLHDLIRLQGGESF